MGFFKKLLLLDVALIAAIQAFGWVFGVEEVVQEWLVGNPELTVGGLLCLPTAWICMTEPAIARMRGEYEARLKGASRRKRVEPTFGRKKRAQRARQQR